MRAPFFIAKRYLLAKKSHNLINIITWISIISISVASFALIVVLSAFNGLEAVISKMSSLHAPDLQITPAKGKSIDLNTFPLEEVNAIKGVALALPSITEDALFRTDDKQHIGQVKGVSKEYEQIKRISNTVFNNKAFVLSDGQYDYAIPGAGVAWYLGINIYEPYSLLRIYLPKRGKASSFSLENSFNSGTLNVTSVFVTEQEIDNKVVLVPYEWLSKLMDYEQRATEIELFYGADADARRIKEGVKKAVGADFIVKDQHEQQATLYKVMRSEKWAVYAILTFILILATFNVVGSLSMLMIDKRKDTEILRAMGADQSFLRRLFLNEGLLISVAGGLIGLLLGILVVLLQQQFGFVKFGSGGNYIVDAYPVALKLWDTLAIFFTIMVIGCTAAWLTVRKFTPSASNP